MNFLRSPKPTGHWIPTKPVAKSFSKLNLETGDFWTLTWHNEKERGRNKPSLGRLVSCRVSLKTHILSLCASHVGESF